MIGVTSTISLDNVLKNVSKILIIQTAFAGDVILTTPLVREIHTGMRNAEVHFLAIPTTVNILENNPHLSHIWQYDKRCGDSGMMGFVRIAKILRQQNFDLVLSPHRSLRSAGLAVCCGARCRVGFDKSAGSFLLTRTIAFKNNLHEIDRNLSLLAPFDIRPQNRLPEVFPNLDDVAVVDKKMGKWNLQSDLIAIAPGSVWATKRWPQESFSALCKSLRGKKTKVVLMGGMIDRPLCEQIATDIGAGIVNLAGEMTFRQSAELLKRCRVLVTNDSAPMHLASAVGTPTVAIFGPTIPAFGFSPVRANSRIVEKSLACRPCSIHGSKKCPIGTHDCMIKISPQQVMETVQRVMQEQYGDRSD